MSVIQIPGALVEATPDVKTVSDGRQDLKPADKERVVIQIDDPSGRTSDAISRQKQQLLEEKYRERRRDHDYRWWTRRVCVGKDDFEEQQETEHSQRKHFFKQEFRRHLAEFIGTFFLVLFIAGIQVNQDFYPNTGGVANIDKGQISAFILTGLIFCFGNVSGAHFNPVVTLAFALRGSFKPLRFLTYIVVQFAGAVSGAAVLWQLVGDPKGGLGGTTPGPGISHTDAFGIEILMSFILVSVVLSTAINAKVLGPVAALAVGATFGAIELFAWNWTGASVNPWRSIGPIMISDHGWRTYWIYIIGPIVGSILAVIMQRIMVTGIKREIMMDYGTGEGKNGRM